MPIYSLGNLSPVIDSDSFIAPDAAVIGDVFLARGASIWFHCTVRGDTDHLFIGENSNIQDNSVLHTDPGLPLRIGCGVTVGHRVIVHGSTIGDHSLIGMGATLLNRSVIGKYCLIGANTLIPEGKVIPDRSLVIGSPGRIVRELTEEEILRLQENAAHYVENWRRYKREFHG